VDEDTTDMDRELIAAELERVAKLARRLNRPDLAEKIAALAADARKTEGNS
jgi:hypothetical protein